MGDFLQFGEFQSSSFKNNLLFAIFASLRESVLCSITGRLSLLPKIHVNSSEDLQTEKSLLTIPNFSDADILELRPHRLAGV
jgi:hypothetical protein